MNRSYPVSCAYIAATSRRDTGTDSASTQARRYSWTIGSAHSGRTKPSGRVMKAQAAQLTRMRPYVTTGVSGGLGSSPSGSTNMASR